MEALLSFETSVLTRATRRNIREDTILNIQPVRNVESIERASEIIINGATALLLGPERFFFSFWSYTQSVGLLDEISTSRKASTCIPDNTNE
jgi:hypothetical protein